MNRLIALGFVATAFVCVAVDLDDSTVSAQQSLVTRQLVQAEIVKVSLRVEENLTDVVTHIYKPSAPGVTAFPLVIYSHGRPFNPNPPNTVALPNTIMPSRIGGFKKDLRWLRWCVQAMVRPAEPTANIRTSFGNPILASANLHMSDPY
jgi:hypothetical protein